MAETRLWVVEKDGQVLQRGFQSESAAWTFTDGFVKKLLQTRNGTKIRVPEFQVKIDRQYLKDDDVIWNDCKTHTQVVI